MNGEECVICADAFINNKHNCHICNNGICNNCYISLVRKSYDSLNHKCPFCKTKNFKKIVEIDINIIINFYEKKEYILNKDISKLNQKIFDKDDEIRRLKSIIKEKNKEIASNNDFIDEQTNIINTTMMSYDIKSPIQLKKMSYQRFYKITYWGLRESDVDITAQEAMKRVSLLWKQYKLSFE